MGLVSRKEAVRVTTTSWNFRTPQSTNTARDSSTDPNAMNWEVSANAAVIEEENKTLKGKRAK